MLQTQALNLVPGAVEDAWSTVLTTMASCRTSVRPPSYRTNDSHSYMGLSAEAVPFLQRSFPVNPLLDKNGVKVGSTHRVAAYPAAASAALARSSSLAIPAESRIFEKQNSDGSRGTATSRTPSTAGCLRRFMTDDEKKEAHGS